MTQPPSDPFEGHSLNLPFEPVPDPTSMLDDHVHWSAGVVIASLRLDLDTGPHPAVLFRFAKPDGSGFYPPMILATDDVKDLARLPDLFREAIEYAIQTSAS